MENLVHGGDWAGYRAQFGRDALDFSANVSPLGLPEGVANAITAALPTADRYPDPLCRELRAKLALHEGVPADHILCGNGAADLIFRLVWAKKPRRALVTAPTFAEYAAALETVGCTVERFILQAADDFAVPEAFLSAIDDRVDLVFLCQPNNPTGQLTPPDLVARILQRCTACGALLVLDECFLDFLPDHAQLTAKPLLGSGDLLILKAFTKLYGMAGVRLGYALSADTALLDAMQHTGQPWAVSSLAQAAGLAALDGITLNSPADAVGEIVNFSTNCINSQTFINYLNTRAVYVSGGSACDKGEPSHTLLAMGCSDLTVRTALRVSLCADNTAEDVDALLAGVRDGLKELQHI